MKDEEVVEQTKQKFDLLMNDFIGLQQEMSSKIMALKITLDELFELASVSNNIALTPETLLHQQKVDLLKEKWFTS